MNVLVIGDEHTYGYGLSGGKLSYIGHFIRQISRAGRAVSVEAYAHLTMAQTIAMLATLPLNRYDLIMLQLDHTLLLEPASQIDCLPPETPLMPMAGLVTSPVQPGFRYRMRMVRAAIRSLIRPDYPLTSLSVLLDELRPYRHNVLLMTPFPNQNPFSGWLRRCARVVLLREAERRLVSVFDTNSVIRSREEYFLPNDTSHFNAVSHELLGRSLFDFYQSAPTIITVQSTRRG